MGLRHSLYSLNVAGHVESDRRRDVEARRGSISSFGLRADDCNGVPFLFDRRHPFFICSLCASSPNWVEYIRKLPN